MNSKTVFGLALILFFSGRIPGSATPLRLTGLATASGGQGGGIRVEVSPAFRRAAGGKRTAPVATVRPRPDGFFTLTVPEPGVYRAVARADGFLPLEIAALPVVEATDLPPAELEPALPLEVRVSDPDGKPAAWVAVCARGWDAPSSPVPRWEPAERCGTTAEDGRLVLPRGRDERPVLAVADPRFAAGRFEAGEEASVTLRLAAARAASLEVRGPDGRPAAGVAARIGSDGALGSGGVSDPAGHLAIAAPETGTEVELAGESGLRGRAVFFPGTPIRGPSPSRRRRSRPGGSSTRRPAAPWPAPWSGPSRPRPAPVRTAPSGSPPAPAPTSGSARRRRTTAGGGSSCRRGAATSPASPWLCRRPAPCWRRKTPSAGGDRRRSRHPPESSRDGCSILTAGRWPAPGSEPPGTRRRRPTERAASASPA